MVEHSNCSEKPVLPDEEIFIQYCVSYDWPRLKSLGSIILVGNITKSDEIP
jgi:hypothetical protein